VIVVVSLVLAAISLVVLRDVPAYDPWSWLVWGREAFHLNLDTRSAATSVKPLPIAITTLLAPTGGAAPTLWLLIARAAALAAIGIAYRLGATLTGRPLAGFIAAAGVLMSYQFISYLFFQGMSEPMATATALAAADRATSGRQRTAFVALLATAMLRIEAWPIVVLFLAWRLWRDPAPRRLIAGAQVVVALPLAWFSIDWLGSRDWLRSAGAASSQSQGGPLLSTHPGLATLAETRHLAAIPLLVAFLVTILVSAVKVRTSKLAQRLLVMGSAALLWLLVAAAMAQAGLATGAPRYLLPATGVAIVVGAAGIAIALDHLWKGREDGWSRAAAVALAVAILGGSVPMLALVEKRVHGQVVEARQRVRTGDALVRAVHVAGLRIRSCGPLVTQPLQVPGLAWQTHVPLEHVMTHPASTGTVLQLDSLPAISSAFAGNYHQVGTAGVGGSRWTVMSTC
jgi:hypothetical protein